MSESTRAGQERTYSRGWAAVGGAPGTRESDTPPEDVMPPAERRSGASREKTATSSEVREGEEVAGTRTRAELVAFFRFFGEELPAR